MSDGGSGAVHTMQHELSELAMDLAPLEQLDDELSQFNLFEALGSVHYENRHSDFLRWLLSPDENHGLGDSVLRRFLQRAVYNAKRGDLIDPVTLASCNLDEAEVKREITKSDNKRRVDIEILDRANRLAVVVENKVHSSERQDQLASYHSHFLQEYPDFRRLCIYMTLLGEEPSEANYVSMSYSQLANMLDDILQRRRASVGDDVEMAIRHYIQVLRRYFVEDSKLVELARNFYRKHKRALDYVYEHKPDFRLQLGEALQSLIKKNGELHGDDSSKRFVRFRQEFVNVRIDYGSHELTWCHSPLPPSAANPLHNLEI